MVLLRRHDRFLKISSQFPVLRNRSNIPSERPGNLSGFDLPDFSVHQKIGYFLSNLRSKSRGPYDMAHILN